MLSRNLYELPSVYATLLYALQNADSKTALYAAKEIYDSEEDAELFRLLTISWLLSDYNDPFEWARYSAFSLHNIESFTMAMIADNTVSTLPSLKPSIKYTTEPPSNDGNCKDCGNWYIYPHGWTKQMSAKLFKAVSASLKKYNIERCVSLTAQLIDTGDFAALSALLHSFGISSEFTQLFFEPSFMLLKYRILEHAFAIIVAYKRGYSDNLVLLKDELKFWRKSPTYERLLQISPDALLLWSIKTPLISDLNLHTILCNDESKYWTKIRNQYDIVSGDGFIPIINNNEIKFYKTVFPNDLPDEWEFVELHKSHFTNPITKKFKTNPWVSLILMPT